MNVKIWLKIDKNLSRLWKIMRLALLILKPIDPWKRKTILLTVELDGPNQRPLIVITHDKNTFLAND